MTRVRDATLAELTDRWVGGWASMRQLPVAEVLGWPLVRVGLPSRDTELVCVDAPGTDLVALLDAVRGDPSAMLTIVAEPDAGALPGIEPGAGIRLDRDTETLMAVELPDVDAAATPPDGLTVEVDTAPHVIRVRLLHGQTAAAWGSVGVIGPDAVFDRIETVEAYQRRGIGSWMMRELTRRARELGAVDGILTASSDGAALYGALGWSMRGRLTSLMGIAAG